MSPSCHACRIGATCGFFKLTHYQNFGRFYPWIWYSDNRGQKRNFPPESGVSTPQTPRLREAFSLPPCPELGATSILESYGSTSSTFKSDTSVPAIFGPRASI